MSTKLTPLEQELLSSVSEFGELLERLKAALDHEIATSATERATQMSRIQRLESRQLSLERQMQSLGSLPHSLGEFTKQQAELERLLELHSVNYSKATAAYETLSCQVTRLTVALRSLPGAMSG